MIGQVRRFPPAYLREYRRFMHPEDRDARNPRLRCTCCGDWRALGAKDGTRQFRLYCPHNTVNRQHLAPYPPKYPILCNRCCDSQCAHRAVYGITEPARPFRKPPPTAAQLEKKAKEADRARRTLSAIEIKDITPFEMLTDRQIQVLLYHAQKWRFYRASGDDRARFFLERLQRLAKRT